MKTPDPTKKVKALIQVERSKYKILKTNFDTLKHHMVLPPTCSACEKPEYKGRATNPERKDFH